MTLWLRWIRYQTDKHGPFCFVPITLWDVKDANVEGFTGVHCTLEWIEKVSREEVPGSFCSSAGLWFCPLGPSETSEEFAYPRCPYTQLLKVQAGCY